MDEVNLWVVIGQKICLVRVGIVGNVCFRLLGGVRGETCLQEAIE